MTTQEFIESIKVVVVDSSIEGLKSVLTKPAGRSPNKETIKLSNWYNSLTEDDQEMVQKVIKEAVNASVFGFLCVLDGVKAIEGLGEKGVLELHYIKEGKRSLLNDREKEYSTTYFNRKSYPSKLNPFRFLKWPFCFTLSFKPSISATIGITLVKYRFRYSCRCSSCINCNNSYSSRRLRPI